MKLFWRSCMVECKDIRSDLNEEIDRRVNKCAFLLAEPVTVSTVQTLQVYGRWTGDRLCALQTLTSIDDAKIEQLELSVLLPQTSSSRRVRVCRLWCILGEADLYSVIKDAVGMCLYLLIYLVLYESVDPRREVLKFSRYRPEQVVGDPEVKAPDFLDFRHNSGGEIVTLTPWPSLLPGVSWYSFLDAESTPEHMVPSGASEKIPSNTTGDRSGDPPSSSAVP
jgi:hypothetical protein